MHSVGLPIQDENWISERNADFTPYLLAAKPGLFHVKHGVSATLYLTAYLAV
jgi:hypothetical protein